MLLYGILIIFVCFQIWCDIQYGVASSRWLQKRIWERGMVATPSQWLWYYYMDGGFESRIHWLTGFMVDEVCWQHCEGRISSSYLDHVLCFLMIYFSVFFIKVATWTCPLMLALQVMQMARKIQLPQKGIAAFISCKNLIEISFLQYIFPFLHNCVTEM